MSRSDRTMAEEIRPGIYIQGTIVGRTKKEATSETSERVRYTILTGTDIQHVTRWGKHDYATVGTTIVWPIAPRPFINRYKAPVVAWTYQEPQETDF